MSRIFIGALSALAYDERRERCRSTWFKDAIGQGHPPKFLLGCEGVERPFTADCLNLLVPDDYPSLPQRTQAWAKWALAKPGWKWLFKCDDDTFVAVDRLAAMAAALPDGVDYVGAEWHLGVGYGSGGAGYLLSRKAAAIVAEKLTAKVGAEDLLVGQALLDSGIRLHIERRLMPFGSDAMRPLPTNDLITAHGIPGEMFLDSHRQLNSL